MALRMSQMLRFSRDVPKSAPVTAVVARNPSEDYLRAPAAASPQIQPATPPPLPMADFGNLIELTDTIKRFGQIGTSLSERVGCFRLPLLPACSVLALLLEFKPLFFKFGNFFLDLRKLSMCFLGNQGVAGFE